MRYVTCLLVALCISASMLYAAHPKGQQPSTSEKQQARKQGTQNPEAYALYLEARSYWAKRTRADFETAVSYFNQAIAKDPGYAMAYAGLADCYAMLPDYGASEEDIPKAKAAALKAIELDPTLSRPHVNLGGMKMAHEWDFAGGEAEFKKALELDPTIPMPTRDMQTIWACLGAESRKPWLKSVVRTSSIQNHSPSALM
jgi:tetratricopeptide (TPR) repeat protein